MTNRMRPSVTVSGATHTPVDCSGINQDGTRCRRFRWFSKTETTPSWVCHDHKEFAK